MVTDEPVPPRLLIVDPRAILHLEYAACTVAVGFEVEQADNTEQGLAKAMLLAPDIVLTDCSADTGGAGLILPASQGASGDQPDSGAGAYRRGRPAERQSRGCGWVHGACETVLAGTAARRNRARSWGMAPGPRRRRRLQHRRPSDADARASPARECAAHGAKQQLVGCGATLGELVRGVRSNARTRRRSMVATAIGR